MVAMVRHWILLVTVDREIGEAMEKCEEFACIESSPKVAPWWHRVEALGCEINQCNGKAHCLEPKEVVMYGKKRGRRKSEEEDICIYVSRRIKQQHGSKILQMNIEII